LIDNSPAVRETAVRLSEPFLAKTGAASAHPENRALTTALLKLVDDPSIRVRYQLAFSLGEWRDRLAGKALAALALKDAGNANIQTAILSSVQPHLQEFIEALFSNSANDGPPANLLAQVVGMSVAGKDQRSLTNILARLSPPANGDAAPWQLAVFAGFLDALNGSGSSLSEFQTTAAPQTKRIVASLTRLFAQARSWTAPDRLQSGGGGQRAVLIAIPLLGRGPDGFDADVDRLASLLQPQVEIPVQQVALARLGRLSGPKVGGVLLDNWKSFSPSMRIEVLNTLLRRTDWAVTFLDRVESGAIAPSETAPSHQQSLLKHSNESVRERAQRVFASRNSNRQEIVKQYASVGELTGDSARGLALYREHCSTCHRLRGEGNNVGPDLTTVADKPVGMLVVAILDPNQIFESKYINYTAVLKDGREISGIITTETPNSLTVRVAGGKDEVILRQDLRDLNSSHISTMPEGFEAVLKPQDMADLIGGIRNR
jgi:putative heme-binding domain-containing protein